MCPETNTHKKSEKYMIGRSMRNELQVQANSKMGRYTRTFIHLYVFTRLCTQGIGNNNTYAVYISKTYSLT